MNKLQQPNNKDFYLFRDPNQTKKEKIHKFYLEIINNKYRITLLEDNDTKELINFFILNNIKFDNKNTIGFYLFIDLDCNEKNKNLLLKIMNDIAIHDLNLIEKNRIIKKQNKQVYEDLKTHILSLGFSIWKNENQMYNFPEELKSQLNMIEIDSSDISTRKSELTTLIIKGYENSLTIKKEINITQKTQNKYDLLENKHIFRLIVALYEFQYEGGTIRAVKNALLSSDLDEDVLMEINNLIEKFDEGEIDSKIFRNSFHYTNIFSDENIEENKLISEYFKEKYGVEI